ncbi:MAG: cation transporter [Bacteroidetes bacterium]|nr:MAG: cation transporter [Bacteroidota bacterium]
MNFFKISISILSLVLISFSANAQSCGSSKSKKASCCASKTTKAQGTSDATGELTSASLVVSTDAVEKNTFKVFGNCGMCKSRIEGALKDVKGVQFSSWDTDTKMLEVHFDASLITIEKIHQKVAAVGHDTEKVRAEDEVYNNLHGCCQYERAKV